MLSCLSSMESQSKPIVVPMENRSRPSVPPIENRSKSRVLPVKNRSLPSTQKTKIIRDQSRRKIVSTRPMITEQTSPSDAAVELEANRKLVEENLNLTVEHKLPKPPRKKTRPNLRYKGPGKSSITSATFPKIFSPEN